MDPVVRWLLGQVEVDLRNWTRFDATNSSLLLCFSVVTDHDQWWNNGASGTDLAREILSGLLALGIGLRKISPFF